MASKSEKKKRKKDRRISATEASRSFSSLLDKVEAGAHFLIHRRGQDICVIAPAPVQGRTPKECLEILRGRSPVTLDDRFGEDLLKVIAEDRAEEMRSWDS